MQLRNRLASLVIALAGLALAAVETAPRIKI